MLCTFNVPFWHTTVPPIHEQVAWAFVKQQNMASGLHTHCSSLLSMRSVHGGAIRKINEGWTHRSWSWCEWQSETRRNQVKSPTFKDGIWYHTLDPFAHCVQHYAGWNFTETSIKGIWFPLLRTKTWESRFCKISSTTQNTKNAFSTSLTPAAFVGEEKENGFPLLAARIVAAWE